MGDSNNGNQRGKINLDWAAHLVEQSVLAFFYNWPCKKKFGHVQIGHLLTIIEWCDYLKTW